MVSINKTNTQRMPQVTHDVGLEPVMVTTIAEATHTKEIPRQKNLVSREEVVHGKYPNLVHQKEVYQETMDVIWSLQGEIQCLKEQSRREEKRRKVKVPKDDLDEVKEVCKMIRQENIIPLLGAWLRDKVPCTGEERERQVLHENLPLHILDYDREITLNAFMDGWILSNILIDTGTEVNVLTLDAWHQM
ncbi:hypothetical protein KI387_030161, partial [Taxus chinensis]